MNYYLRNDMVQVKQIFGLSLFILLFGTGILHGQDPNLTDSIAIKNTFSIFRQGIAVQLRLYNGIEEREYTSELIGSPYYLNDSLTSGSVTYDGIKYNNVFLMYDMLKESVIIKYFDTPFRIRLLNDKLNSFNLSGHQFVRITPKDNIRDIKEGNYDQLYKGSFRLLAHRSALAQEVISDNKVQTRINRGVQYFIIKDNAAYLINNSRYALKIVQDNGVIKSYLKKNKLKYKKNKEEVLLKIVSYRDKY